jgi:hypothetical protein
LSNNKNSIKCVACKSDIVAGASICAVCKSYQSRWKNVVVFVGSASLLTILTSLVVLLYANGKEVWEYVTWRDEVQIVTLVPLRKSESAQNG